MAKRIIKEGEPIDPIHLGDIVTLELLDGSTISELLSVDPSGSSCIGCALNGASVKCTEGWNVKDSDKFGRGSITMALCCTNPVLGPGIEVRPKFCKFIKLDSVLEEL